MEAGSKVGWKKANGSRSLSLQDLQNRIEDHGKGPFTVIEVDDYLGLGPGSRLISFFNKDGILVTVNEGFLEEIETEIKPKSSQS